MQNAEYSTPYPTSVNVEETSNSNTDHTHVTTLERSFCTNFTCCSLVLPDLHALFEHHTNSPVHAHLPLRLRIPVEPAPPVNLSPYSTRASLSSDASSPPLSPSSSYSSQASTPPLSPTSDARSLSPSQSSPTTPYHPSSHVARSLWPTPTKADNLHPQNQNHKTDASTDAWNPAHASHLDDLEYGTGFPYGFQYHPDAVHVPLEEMEIPTYEQCYHTFSKSLSSPSPSAPEKSSITRSTSTRDVPTSDPLLSPLEAGTEHHQSESSAPKLSALFAPILTACPSYITGDSFAPSPSPISSSSSSPSPSPSPAPRLLPPTETANHMPSSPETNLRMTRGRASGMWTRAEISVKRTRKSTEKARKTSLKAAVSDPVPALAAAATTSRSRKFSSKSGSKSTSGLLTTVLGGRGSSERSYYGSGNGHGHGRRKTFVCPTKGCTKAYLNPNGLKYHVEKGTCNIEEIEGSDVGADVVAMDGVMEDDRANSEDIVDGILTDANTMAVEDGGHDDYPSISPTESLHHLQNFPQSQSHASSSPSLSRSRFPSSVPPSPTLQSLASHPPRTSTPHGHHQQQRQIQVQLQHPYPQQQLPQQLQHWYGYGSCPTLCHDPSREVPSVSFASCEDMPVVDVRKEMAMEIDGGAMGLEA